MSKKIEWDVAEVLKYDYTYQYIPSGSAKTTDKLFGLWVRSCSGYFNDEPFLAKPSNINMKQIPLVGEFVLVYKTFNQQATTNRWRETWYYVTSIDVQSSINSNLLPGLSNGDDQENIDNTESGKTFKQKSISPLQPFEGDLMIEGRFGNSIRFGSTITTYPERYYYKKPKYVGKADGDPIIMLSNGRVNPANKEFVVEDIDTDASSLYLTSTQNVDMAMSNPLTRTNDFQGSHLLGVGDRVVLRAKTDVVILDAKRGIILNTPDEVRIGTDSADQPLMHGDLVVEFLNDLLSALTLGCTSEGSIRYAEELTSLQERIPQLISTKYFIENTATPTISGSI